MSEHLGLRDIAKLIDHSLLHPTMTDEVIAAGCADARNWHVATVCVKPYAVVDSVWILGAADVGVCAVAGFPHGNSATSIKVAEAEQAMVDGAIEVDVVANVGKALGGQWEYVSEEVKAVNDAVVGLGGALKVIFETDYLQDEHILRLCDICSEHAVAFVKTSTGYGFVKQPNGMYAYSGATDHNLKLMRERCPVSVQIKAAGGLRTLDDILRARSLGVSRIGASATGAILEEATRRGYA